MVEAAPFIQTPNRLDIIMKKKNRLKDDARTISLPIKKKHNCLKSNLFDLTIVVLKLQRTSTSQSQAKIESVRKLRS